MKKEYELNWLDMRHYFSAVRYLKSESGHEWTERLLWHTQGEHRDGQAIDQAKAIKLWMKSRFIATVRMDRLLLSETK